MHRWIQILSMAALAAALAVGTAAADDALEDFLVLGADPEDFRPVSEVVSSGSLFFVGGFTGMGPLDPFGGDAAIVALDERDGSEVWRASEGEADVPERFSVVGVAGGRVCAASTVNQQLSNSPFLVEREVLIACYRADRGERLWVRRIELDPARGSVAPPLLHVSSRAVVVTLTTPPFLFPDLVFGDPEILVLRFDARDGTGR